MTSPSYDPTINDWGTKTDVGEGPNHAIDETVTGGAFASIRDKAWHNLGVVVDHQVSSRELLRLAHCAFPIYTAPITSTVNRTDADGNVVAVQTATDNRRVNLLRDHPETGLPQILGQVSDGYPLWTPEEILCGFGDGILQYGEPTVSTCGALDEGRQVFMSFKLPKTQYVAGIKDEALDLWLVAHTSFDGSVITSATVTTIRAVCRNTIRAGAKAAVSRMTIKKTRNAKLAVEQARTALGLVDPYLEILNREAEALLNTPVSNDLFNEIITREFGPEALKHGEEPSKKAADAWEPRETALMELFTKADTQANVRHTAWAGVQAIGEYCDWFMGVKGSKGWDAERVATAQFKRSLFGDPTVDKPKAAAQRAFRELAGLAN